MAEKQDQISKISIAKTIQFFLEWSGWSLCILTIKKRLHANASVPNLKLYVLS